MTARVGAIHLGWDVVSVAAGGGGTPIRPVQVEGTYTPPAYLLADASGRLHTAGGERQRPDLGIAISDVRDVLGHRQIRIAGATWPVELVFRARMYNPLAATGKYLRGKPEVVALPFPDDWPDEKIDEYCRLVELLDVATEPLPESVALSGYVRALGLVRPPEPGFAGSGATGVYSDGRVCLVVAVHGDDEQPTESVGVPISPDAIRDAHSADNVVIEVMAAARSISADTSTVLLTGNVCFNDALRLAFQNHLGHRLRVADHPMHALALGAAHLLVTDSEYAEEEAYPDPEPPRPAPGPDARQAASRHPNPPPGEGPSYSTQRQPPGSGGAHGSAEEPGRAVGREGRAPGSGHPAPGLSGGGRGADPGNPGPGPARQTSSAPGTSAGGQGMTSEHPGSGRRMTSSPATRDSEGGRHSLRTPQAVAGDTVRHGGRPVDPASQHAGLGAQPLRRQPEPMPQQPYMAPRHTDSPPRVGRHAAREVDEEPTTRVTRGPDGLPDVATGNRGGSPGPTSEYERPEHAHGEGDDHGKMWHRVKDNLFGAPTIVGAVALAAMALSPDGGADHVAHPADEVVTSAEGQAPDGIGLAAHVPGAWADARDIGFTAPGADRGAPHTAVPGAVGDFDVRSVGAFATTDFGAWPSIEQVAGVPHSAPLCALTPSVTGPGSPGVGATSDGADCPQLGINNLQYSVPTPRGVIDHGPPMHI
ncbi:hypothetical protein [Nocardia mexicana]|uniref:hypothetical protein n=1 Tax=Nocardia mexicana TaxID=279262 RepID=UPI001FE6F365|nr:hypothetical protein [Nocardia mexicana]